MKIWPRLTLSRIAIVLIAVIYLYCQYQCPTWRRHLQISWDVQEYYMYLPATVIYHDLSFKFIENLPREESKHYSVHKYNGQYVGRMTLGMSLMYLPFFLIAHLIALIFGYEANGYSGTYQYFIGLSGVFYAIMGLYFLKKFLHKYFSDLVTSLTITLIAFATNLYYYSIVEGGMSHAALFGLFSAFLYFTDKWHQEYKLQDIVLASFFLALSILIRPISIIAILIFFFYDVKNFKDLSQKVKTLLQKPVQIILPIVIALFVAFPQLLYWKIQTGHWLYYSYEDQGFFFNDPKIIQGLFGWRKGLFIYTPVMFFAFLGFIFLRNGLKKFILPIGVFLIVNIYVLFSWWCWWYGGSFGMRAMIESYVFLSIPLAAFIKYVFRRKPIVLPYFVIVLFLVVLNIFQSWQYRINIIHWDSMNKEMYFKSFGRRTAVPDQDKYLSPPDYQKGVKGIDR